MLSYKPNNEEGHKRLIAKLKWSSITSMPSPTIPRNRCRPDEFNSRAWPHQNGTIPLRPQSENYSSGHQMPRARGGQSLRRRASFFPSSGAVNPALTIIANALRVGARILERL